MKYHSTEYFFRPHCLVKNLNKDHFDVTFRYQKILYICLNFLLISFFHTLFYFKTKIYYRNSQTNELQVVPEIRGTS